MRRWLRATLNSWRGLVACAATETAFREELVLLVASVPAAYLLTADNWKRLALIASIALILVVELLNTAIEKLCDVVSTDHDPRIARIKDMGSAAIGVTLIVVLALWAAAAIEFIVAL